MFEGEKIRLRALEPEDIDVLYEWENDFEMWKVSATIQPFSRHILEKFIESQHLDVFQLKQLRLIIETKQDKKTTGMIDLFDFDVFNSRAGVGIMIHKDFRKKGFAKEALELLSNYSFSYLNIHQLYCNISEKNTESLKLFENAGFEKIALRKDWIFNGSGFENVWFLQKINPNHKT